METRLKRLGIDFPFMVAPMVGVTNLPFRELVRSYLPEGFPAVLFTEMLSSRRLANSHLNTVKETRFKPGEAMLVTQLLANEDRFIRPSVERLDKAGVFGIDINMGCPVSRALKYNWGVKLMGDMSYAAQVVEATRKATKSPVSVKLRASLGESYDADYLEKFTAALENAGADWITVHARTQGQKHSGKANYAVVQQVARNRKIPVVANGDIQTADDAMRVMSDWQMDGAMIGRAATVRPWILAQIAKRLNLIDGELAARVPETPADEGRAYFEACRFLLREYRTHFVDEALIIKQFRFFISQGVRWLSFGHHFWSEVTGAQTVEALETLLSNYAHVDQWRMVSRIEH